MISHFQSWNISMLVEFIVMDTYTLPMAVPDFIHVMSGMNSLYMRYAAVDLTGMNYMLNFDPYPIRL